MHNFVISSSIHNNVYLTISYISTIVGYTFDKLHDYFVYIANYFGDACRIYVF